MRVNQNGKPSAAIEHTDDGGMLCGIWLEGEFSKYTKWTSEISIAKYMQINSEGDRIDIDKDQANFT